MIKPRNPYVHRFFTGFWYGEFVEMGPKKIRCPSKILCISPIKSINPSEVKLGTVNPSGFEKHFFRGSAQSFSLLSQISRLLVSLAYNLYNVRPPSYKLVNKSPSNYSYNSYKYHKP